MAKQPNILMVIADDHSKLDTGCYGNEVVSTPHMDRLAEEGMRFNWMFTPCAMCAPSRSSLFSGLYPMQHGGFPNHSQMDGDTKLLADYLKPLGYRVAIAGKSHLKPDSIVDFEMIPKYDRESIEGFITDVGDQPFCLIVGSHDPHVPWDQGGSHPERVNLHPYLLDTPSTRKWMSHYYFEVSRVDALLGMCDMLLQENGLADDTVLVYTVDHGAQWPHAKWTCYDAGLNIPFIVRWPGQVEAGSVSDALASFVDFVPTCIEIAGGDVVDVLDGQSLVPVLRGETATHHDAVFGISSRDGLMNEFPMRTIRTATHRYIWNLTPEKRFTTHITKMPAPAEAAQEVWPEWLKLAQEHEAARQIVDAYQHRPEQELYELETDGYEMNNVADEPANREWVDVLRKRLELWMAEQGDEGMGSENAWALIHANQLQSGEAKYQDYLRTLNGEKRENQILAGNIHES